jgi:hypothetical protein
MKIQRGDRLLNVSDPISLERFAWFSKEYETWEKQIGIYFIFLNGELEYIGEVTKCKCCGLARRIAQHCDLNPLMRRHIEENHYTVSFFPLPGDEYAIKEFERELINCDPIPYGNITVFQRQKDLLELPWPWLSV